MIKGYISLTRKLALERLQDYADHYQKDCCVYACQYGHDRVNEYVINNEHGNLCNTERQPNNAKLSNMNNWNKKMIGLVQHIKTWSKDKSTQTAAVIIDPESHAILSVGYNGFPRGVNDSIQDRYERPLKYKFTEHAERNAIYNAARNGIRLNGATMYMGWFPCADCARAIVQSGISILHCDEPDFNDERWGEDFKVSMQLLEEGGVKIDYSEDLL